MTENQIDQEGLSNQSIQTLRDFSIEIHNLKYPCRLKNSNISIRSLLTFYYDYQPDKVLSLKIQNLLTTEEHDLMIFSIQQFIDKVGDKKDQIMAQFSGLPMHQEIICKQTVAIYEMINSSNIHRYIKDPYTLNNYVYSNGFLVANLIYIHSNILQQLKNNANLFIIDTFFNMQLLQDILKYDDYPIKLIKTQLQAIQVINSNIYMNIQQIDDEKRQRVLKFIQGNEQFTVSRYVIQDYIILFTTLSPIELKNHLKNISGTDLMQFYPHSFNLLEQRLGIYTAVYQTFLITNLTIQYETIAYRMPDGLLYQFDINSIFYLLQLQLLLKRLLQIDFQQPEPTKYIEMLEHVFKPKQDQIVFKHKIFIPPIIQHKKKHKSLIPSKQKIAQQE